MANPIVGTLIGGVPGLVNSIIVHNGTRNLQCRSVNAQDILAKDILESQSAHIVGYFLDTERCDDINFHYRETALSAAVRLINNPETDSNKKGYLKGLIDKISETKYDDLQEDAKELLMSCADDTTLMEIALDDEDVDIRISAVQKMTDVDMLIDVATNADDNDVRQSAKKRIKELR